MTGELLMAKFFVPVTRTVDLPSGRRVAVVRGLREESRIDPEVLSTIAGNRVGIKPEHEMTEADYRSLGMVPLDIPSTLQ